LLKENPRTFLGRIRQYQRTSNQTQSRGQGGRRCVRNRKQENHSTATFSDKADSHSVGNTIGKGLTERCFHLYRRRLRQHSAFYHSKTGLYILKTNSQRVILKEFSEHLIIRKNVTDSNRRNYLKLFTCFLSSTPQISSANTYMPQQVK
jgi:hypothetical protein